MKVMVIPIVTGALGSVSKILVQGLENLEKKKSGNYPKYCIIKIGQNTWKGPRDLIRLAATQK